MRAFHGFSSIHPRLARYSNVGSSWHSTQVNGDPPASVVTLAVGTQSGGGCPADIFLKKARLVDTIGKTMEALGSILHIWQDHGSHPPVIVDEVALGESFLPPVDLVQVGQRGLKGVGRGRCRSCRGGRAASDRRQSAPCGLAWSLRGPLRGGLIGQRAGSSRWTSCAGLSSRNPTKIGCRMRPSRVHSWNRTSQTNRGSTQ